MWYVTRYDDVVAVLNDPARYSSADAVNVPLDYTAETRHAIETSFLSQSSLTNNDPPSHTRIRRLVNEAFRERQVADLEVRVRAIANDLIDRFEGRGHAEFVREFSFPLPMRVILNVLGAPEADLMKLKGWADDWITLISRQLSPEEQADTIARLLESQLYWTALIEDRKAAPRDDLLTGLVTASQEEENPIGMLTLINICSVLTLAGHETTTNLLSLCLYRLLGMPEQWQLVCKDATNIAKAIEETLRADTSVHALFRTTTEPVELRDVKLPQGARLALLFASANHDEGYFADAARFDLRREEGKGHLAFGRGIHYCVGAPLARLEGRIALELLIQRLPGLRLGPGQQIEYVVNPIHRGLKALGIEWDVR
jgi:cytochrome P450